MVVSCEIEERETFAVISARKSQARQEGFGLVSLNTVSGLQGIGATGCRRVPDLGVMRAAV